ncbi:MAG TPA: phage tail tape measure protein [Xanthobacteraceae bacterium]|nr:phage tail tape measure protein [Xanthobacteraceae bacterium]
MTEIDGISVSVDADLSDFRRELAEADRLSRGFGASFSRALSQAIVQGKSFGDVIRTLGLRLSSLALNAAFKPIEQGLSGAFNGLFSGLMGGGSSLGNLPSVTPFAKGGVVATPSYFPLGNALGVAGERGAEAILPLARGSDGRLGVRAENSQRPLAVNVSITAQDAASFRRSEAFVSGMIARAVARGERNL